jgi:hypothetical protein
MKNFINLTELKLARERFAIALAGSVHATFYTDYTDPENPTPKVDLTNLAEEFMAFSPDDIDKDYRFTVSWLAALRGPSLVPLYDNCDGVVLLDDAGCSEHHSVAITWARCLLNRTHAGLGVRLLPLGGE